MTERYTAHNSNMKTKNILLAVFLTALTVGLYFPTMRWLFIAWLNNEYYSHGLLLLPVSLVLVWLVRKRIMDAPIEKKGCGARWY